MYIIAIFLFQIVSLMLTALKEEAALMETAVSFIKHMIFENHQPNNFKQKNSICIFTLNVLLYQKHRRMPRLQNQPMYQPKNLTYQVSNITMLIPLIKLEGGIIQIHIYIELLQTRVRTNWHVDFAMENGVTENARNFGFKKDAAQLVVTQSPMAAVETR